MSAPAAHPRIRFDRNELSGAFGDLGTDFPLVVGMVLAAGLDVTSVLVMFGLMQVLTGLAYGLPMPVLPLKAMAVIVITQKLAPGVLVGGGLAIGIVMLLLAVTGAVDWLAAVVPRPVVRGIQLGLGLQLAQLALRDYVPSEGAPGYALAAAAFVLTLRLLGSRRYPPATLVILSWRRERRPKPRSSSRRPSRSTAIPIFHLEMGKAQIQLGNRAQAREHLQRAVDLNPAGPEAAEARRRLQELK